MAAKHMFQSELDEVLANIDKELVIDTQGQTLGNFGNNI